MISDMTKRIVEKYIGKKQNWEQPELWHYDIYFKCAKKNLHICDAERYVNIVNLFGYDIGMQNFLKVDQFVYEHGCEIMEATPGNIDFQMIEKAFIAFQIPFKENHKIAS